MHGVLLFHVQAKQNLSEGDGCRGGGEDQGGVTVPGESEPGEHESCIDMRLTAQCLLCCVCECICVCVRACSSVHAKRRGNGMWVTTKVIVVT